MPVKAPGRAPRHGGTPPKETVTRFTIWDNYARHCVELRAVGAKDSDLEPLRAAAAAVEAAEVEADRLGVDVGAATAPFSSCTGWIIAPPTTAARYWASLALIKVTGGKAPDAVLGEFLALLAGLLVLRLWGEGQKDRVMRLIARPTELAELLAAESDTAASLDVELLAGEWLALMGLKKKAALAKYQDMLAEIRRRLARQPRKKTATTRPLRSVPRSRGTTSASPGRISGTASRPR